MANGRLITELGHMNIALGQYNAFEPNFKFARNENIITTESIVWDMGTNFVYLTSAENMLISSSSVNDIFSGSGAWNMLIQGLDSNYDEISEVIILNGTTNVRSINQYLRVYRAFILQSGTYDPINDSNIGEITITAEDEGTIQAGIQPNRGQTLMSQVTIPRGYSGLVTGLSASVGRGRDALILGKANNIPGGAFSVKYTLDLYQSTFFGTFDSPLVLPETTDVIFTAETTTGSVPLSLSYGIIFKRNE